MSEKLDRDFECAVCEDGGVILHYEREGQPVRRFMGNRVFACDCRRGRAMSANSRDKDGNEMPHSGVRPFADIAGKYNMTAVPPRAGALAEMLAKQANARTSEEAPIDATP